MYIEEEYLLFCARFGWSGGSLRHGSLFLLDLCGECFEGEWFAQRESVSANRNGGVSGYICTC